MVGFYDNEYYVIDDDSGAILTGPLSEQSAEDFANEHTNCHVVQLTQY
jgi:hypothetical protein